MNKLNIQQGQNIEIVDADTITKLYNTAISVPEPEEGEQDLAYLLGNLLVNKSYRVQILYLTDRFQDLNINVVGGYYISFEDPEVLRILLVKNIGDGIGVTEEDASNTTISNIFLSNTNITKFNEFLYFGNTKISKGLFKNCAYLASIIISNKITSIGESAFQGCNSLTSIDIPNSVTSIGNYAFYYCNSLTSINIPDNVTSIGDYAFRDCKSLTSCTIGSGVTSIGPSAFHNCSSLTTVNITDIESWCNINFGNSNSNPLCFGHHLYLNNQEITDINIPNTLTTIKGYVFAGASSITSINIPNTITSIGNYTFYYCSGLTNITIPDSVTSIGSDAFRHCSGLTSVTIGSDVTSIGGNAFSNCSSLTTVNITDIESWCNINFGNANSNPLYIGHHLYLNNLEVKNLIIPNTVTAIKNHAFIGGSSIISIDIPNTIISIGNNAFQDCTGLTSVTIPDSVTSIGGNAFRSCSLTSCTIGSGVTSIGNGAFYLCSSLTSVTVLATTPPTLGSDVFRYTSASLAIYVSAESVETYKAADKWSVYADKIQAIPTT